MLQIEHILIDIPASDAAVHFNLHEIAESETDSLGLFGQLARGREDQHLWLANGQIQRVERTKSEHARLSGPALALHYHVTPLDYGQNGPLLHSRGLIKAVCIEASEESFRDAKLVEIIDDF